MLNGFNLNNIALSVRRVWTSAKYTLKLEDLPLQDLLHWEY